MLRFSVEEHCTCTTGILLGCLQNQLMLYPGEIPIAFSCVFLRFIFVVLICFFLCLAVCMLSFLFSVWVRPT